MKQEFDDKWINCPTCNDILTKDTCALCGDELSGGHYSRTAEWANHYLGPFCEECRERYNQEADHFERI